MTRTRNLRSNGAVPLAVEPGAGQRTCEPEHGARGLQRISSRARGSRDNHKTSNSLTDRDLRRLVAASSLNPHQRGTLLALADGLDRQELVICMGVDRLAGQLGIKRRAAQQRLRALEASGVIDPMGEPKGGRSGTGRGYVNRWRLRPDRLCPEGKGAADCAVKSAADCAPKGAAERHQGRSAATPRAQPAAPDQGFPSHQGRNQGGGCPPASLAGGGLPPDPDRKRPWVNSHASADRRKNDRLQQLRAQADWVARNGAGSPDSGDTPGASPHDPAQ